MTVEMVVVGLGLLATISMAVFQWRAKDDDE